MCYSTDLESRTWTGLACIDVCSDTAPPHLRICHRQCTWLCWTTASGPFWRAASSQECGNTARSSTAQPGDFPVLPHHSPGDPARSSAPIPHVSPFWEQARIQPKANFTWVYIYEILLYNSSIIYLGWSLDGEVNPDLNHCEGQEPWVCPSTSRGQPMPYSHLKRKRRSTVSHPFRSLHNSSTHWMFVQMLIKDRGSKDGGTQAIQGTGLL